MTEKLQEICVQKTKAKRESSVKSMSSVLGVLNSVRTIRFIRFMAEMIKNRFYSSSEMAAESDKAEKRISALIDCLIKFISMVSEISFIVVGGYLVQKNIVSMGIFLALYSVRTSVTDLVELSVGFRGAYHDFKVSKERLQFFEGLEAENIPYSETDSGAISTLRGELICFEYGNGVPVLNNVSFSAEKGKITLIKGESGCGKSTLLELCSGLREPQSGIFYSDNRVIPVFAGDLRKNVLLFSQRFHIFSGTVADNWRLARPNASDEEIRKAASIAGLSSVIESFENGYETVLYSNGETLSAGQRQRLMIARAVLSERPVWLLDEITSALDPETASEVEGEMLPLLNDRTVIVTTHKEKTLFTPDFLLCLGEMQNEQR